MTRFSQLSKSLLLLVTKHRKLQSCSANLAGKISHATLHENLITRFCRLLSVALLAWDAMLGLCASIFMSLMCPKCLVAMLAMGFWVWPLTTAMPSGYHVTPRFWPHCIKCTWYIYCKWSRCGAKGQGPTVDWLCYVLDLNCHRWYIGACVIYYVGHHVNMRL